MPLVEYSDSNSGSEAKRPSAILGSSARSLIKRKRDEIDSKSETPGHAQPLPPPLPASFHDLYASGTRPSVVDDPNLHGGRQRLTPHVQGNWATHVYLEWYPTHAESKRLLQLLPPTKEATHDEPVTSNLLESSLGTPLPLHISLSRPTNLVTQQRERFSEFLKASIEQSRVSPFEVSFESVDWVPNAERTRWFLVLRLEQPTNNCLNRLLRVSNQVFGSIGQQPLYALSQPKVRAYPTESRRKAGLHRNRRVRSEDRPGGGPIDMLSESANADFSSHFHISIGWSLQEPSDEELERARSADISDLRSKPIGFDTVKLKIGNAITVIPLAKRVDVGGGIIGPLSEA